MGGSRAARPWPHLYPSPTGFFSLTGDSSLAPVIPHYLRQDKTQLPKVHVGRSPTLIHHRGELGRGPRHTDFGLHMSQTQVSGLLITDMTKGIKIT